MNKNKRLFTIIGYAVLALVVAVVFVFAVVPKNYAPQLNLPQNNGSIGIMFEISGNSSEFANVQESNYKEFESVYNGSFKQNMLTSLFGGMLFKTPEVSRARTSYSPTFTGYKVTLSYNDDQTLKQYGKDYYYGGSQNPVTYKRAYIDVTSENKFGEVNIVIETKEEEKTVYYTIKTYANFSELYKFGDKIVKGE